MSFPFYPSSRAVSFASSPDPRAWWLFRYPRSLQHPFCDFAPSSKTSPYLSRRHNEALIGASVAFMKLFLNFFYHPHNSWLKKFLHASQFVTQIKIKLLYWPWQERSLRTFWLSNSFLQLSNSFLQNYNLGNLKLPSIKLNYSLNWRYKGTVPTSNLKAIWGEMLLSTWFLLSSNYTT